jgi:hypothetical protein
MLLARCCLPGRLSKPKQSSTLIDSVQPEQPARLCFNSAGSKLHSCWPTPNNIPFVPQ